MGLGEVRRDLVRDTRVEGCKRMGYGDGWQSAGEAGEEYQKVDRLMGGLGN